MASRLRISDLENSKSQHYFLILDLVVKLPRIKIYLLCGGTNNFSEAHNVHCSVSQSCPTLCDNIHRIFLKQKLCMNAKLFQSCPTLCNPMDCSPQGSSVHRIFHASILKWVAVSCSRGSSRCPWVSHVSFVSFIGRRILYHWATSFDDNNFIIFLKGLLWR